MLSRLRMSVPEWLVDFENMASEIFQQPRRFTIYGFPQAKYSRKTLDHAIETIISSKIPPQKQEVVANTDHFHGLRSPPDLCRT